MEVVIIIITVLFGVSLVVTLYRVRLHGKKIIEMSKKVVDLEKENNLLEESNESSQRLISLLKSTI